MIEEIRSLNNKIESALLDRDDYKDSPDKAGLRASRVGDCPRLLDYRLQDTLAPLRFNNAIRMERGTWLHLMWTELMSDSLGSDFSYGQEFSFPLNSGDPITGHPDGYIKSLSAIWELKTVSASTFTMIKQNDSPIISHFLQSNLYCLGMSQEAEVSQSLIHYFNVDNGESLFLPCPYDESIANDGIEMFNQRLANKEKGLIAERPYSDPSASPCWYCPAKDKCYDGWVSEVKNMTTTVLDIAEHSELHSNVQDCTTSRAMRLASDKAEKGFKEKVSSYLLSRQIKAAKLGEFSIDIKLGTKGNPLVTIK